MKDFRNKPEKSLRMNLFRFLIKVLEKLNFFAWSILIRNSTRLRREKEKIKGLGISSLSSRSRIK